MTKVTYLILFFLLNISFASANETDSLLKVLDKAIKDRPTFSKKKEARIDSLKLRLSEADNKKEEYKFYKKLYREYRNYNMDSALYITEKQYNIAVELHNQHYLDAAQMNTAEILARMGMYKEAFDIIESFDSKKFNESQLGFYYHLNHSTYTLLFENAQTKKQASHYKNLLLMYKDSILSVHPVGSLGYDLNLTGKYIELGEYDKALNIIGKRYEEYKDNDTMVGSIAYGMASIYEHTGEKELEKKYLTISAINDIQNARKAYISLRKLAIVLYQEKDLDRAYSYIKCSLEDANFCKARFRTLESSEMLPIITAAYDKKVQHEKSNLFKYLALISLLSIILIVSIIYIYIQLKKLSEAKMAMKKLNESLLEMNESLTTLNTQLSESNHVKEEYIGSVFNLCSSYIDKLENYRISINRKLVAKQFEDAVKMTSSGSLVTDELKDFFRNFDAIFLNIYPNFVEQFNALLQEGEQIIPKTGDILTPELRVFALVRLGISDSSKIATFLHYSPQTVYNYNLKVRNKLAVSKEEFAIAIQNIGL